jgi:hypothetical protein
MGANIDFLARRLPCVYPEVNVRVGGVLVNKACYSRLREGLCQPLLCHLTHHLTTGFFLERHEASVVGAACRFLPFSCLAVHPKKRP